MSNGLRHQLQGQQLSLSGELNVATATAALQTLRSLHGVRYLHLEGLQSLDSAGLATLVRWLEPYSAMDRPVILSESSVLAELRIAYRLNGQLQPVHSASL